MRVMSLSLALMSGTVHPMGDSAEIRYSSDIRLSPLIRQQRKAGVRSLDDILKATPFSRRDLATHYTRLAKEYNSRRMIEEATLVSQLWAETSSAFEGDDTGLVVYLNEWNRTYSGRGIPKLLDTDLILRFRKSTVGGPTSSEVKELKAAVTSAKDKASASEDRNKELIKRIVKLEASAGQAKRDGGREKGCFICGGDHLARDCPEKKRNGPNTRSNNNKDATPSNEEEE